MILAHCLIIHFLGRGWRYDCDSQIYTAEDLIHRKIGNQKLNFNSNIEFK